MSDPEKKPVGPYSCGSTQRRPAEEGSLTQFSPPRPIYMLPFYYGRKMFADIEQYLKKKGGYLLIIDSDTNRLTLCVRDENECNLRQPIVKNHDGKFVIEGEREHHAIGFTNVDELLTYYEVYGLAVKEEKTTSSEIRLDTPILCKPDNKPSSERRRPFQQLKDLPHFHGQLSRADAELLLTIDGDYLLREDPEKRGAFVLSMFGNGEYYHRLMERDPMSGGYELPRDNDDDPIECVSMIDEWTQYHALFGMPVNGKFALIRAIKKTEAK